MKKSFKNQLRNLKKSVKKSLSEKICYTLKLTLTVFQNYWNSIRVRRLRERNSRYDLFNHLGSYRDIMQLQISFGCERR